MVCISAELKGIEINLFLALFFVLRSLASLTWASKEGKRGQDFQIFKFIQIEKPRLLSLVNKFTQLRGGFNLGFATNLFRFLSSFKVHCTKCICCSPLEKMPKIGA